LQVDSAAMPVLEGVAAKAQGVVPRIDVSVRTRDDHFALRFRTTLDVPAEGEWTFTCGSDDCSWLWIDEALVVANASIAPHRRKSGTVRLTAGAHALRVVFTEAAGGQSLEVLWRGPGVKEQQIPVERATATSVALVPPVVGPGPDVAAVQRGRVYAKARRCSACHAIDDAALESLPEPAPARPWTALGEGQCPQVRGAAAIRQQAPLRSAVDAAGELAGSLQRDGCLSCHVRDGRGGLQAVAKQGLTEVEDLGDEGRLPPDLTGVGHRLRAAWLEKVLAEGHKARPYVRVRMPKVDRERAQRYAQLFAAVDGKSGDDDEPPFSVELARLGQQVAGTTGRNCVTCHPFAGNRALGAQGMDLAFQYERLRPAWFRDWLLHPTRFRPGTRMLPLWVRGDASDRREVDAVRAWLSLGAAAPLPHGIHTAGRGLVIEPADRPRLHGAFLKGLSARCIAVGTAERTHYAYDVENARLAWLWRGAFLDADGTWSGRAGKLLEPLGEDWLVLDDLGLGGGAPRTVVGHRLLADGHPVFRVAVGAAEFEDEVVPRLAPGGSEVVRTLRCLHGSLAIDTTAAKRGKAQLTVAGAVAVDQYTLQTGASLEVVYRW
ncbi:MAG: PA14 domain-containing protein, partial [Planctomycetota bacterium]|nr:PA14 domain-containing protein [Planctomycetota bacterium]